MNNKNFHLKGGEEVNAVEMLFQQVQASIPSSGSKQSQAKAGDNSSIFHTLLNSEQEPDRPIKQELLQAQITGSDGESMNINSLPTQMQAILNNMISESDNVEEINGNWLNMDALPTKIKELLYNIMPESGNQADVTIPASEMDGNEINLYQFTELGGMPLVMVEEVVVDLAVNQKELAAIVEKVETLLSQIENKQDIKKVAPKILDLLQQWTSMEKKLGNRESGMLSTLNKNEGTKEQAIWRELVQSFQKRDQLAAKQHYNSDSKVTSSDVAKWIGNAIENQGNVERPAGQPNVTDMPITRLEQHVIHLNQARGSQSTGKQLIEQFQKIMQASKFSTMLNGTNQLSITMRPENLGELMVRLTQVNGEMTVKILVTSQATKEMLEANMGQLRNMFSPQQVLIEKQELTAQQEQNSQKEKGDQEGQSKDQNKPQYQDQNNDEQHLEDDFETQFQELLNEKV